MTWVLAPIVERDTGLTAGQLRGMVERPIRASRRSRGGYRWAPGYSERGDNGEIGFPWMTRYECSADARDRGVKAVFVRDSVMAGGANGTS